MTQVSKLHISSSISSDGMIFIYTLSGQIDVSAGSTLDTLDKVPQNAQVILDFAAVDRVNSMGLAQLMKLLEQWKQAQVSIEVRNLSRMVSMLFKMTGLNRYFVNEQTEVSHQVKTVNGATVNSTSSLDQDTPKLRQVHRIRVVKEAHEQGEGNKLQFSVSLQSNQQLSGWYFFNTLLQRRLEKAISVDIKQPGQLAELHENALVFASPFDACALMNEHQFIPIARPMNDTDEVSIIIRKDDKRKNMAEFANATVVTAMQNSFVYLLGRLLCDEYELDSSTLNYSFTNNEIKALQTLLRGQADILFMLKKNYHELSVLSRGDTHLVTESETAMAYHMLLLSPHYETLKSPLTDTLLNLHEDEKGAEVLNDLGLKGWSAPEDDEINMLLMLYKRYVSNV